ncbi:PAQR family membrane homeostasis protein TrhA [Chitinimonas sp. PSY-7]|uniref:PAQR family membrane homeostasis protein TrhA n=1 Tax=Chitinimonas sp. PSY-7 TaxID=3459088 RepID=UPI00404013A1
MYHGERLNSITHLAGSLFSIAGLVVLVVLASQQGNPWKVVSFSIYGAMLVVLYGFSTLYHSIKHPKAKAVLQKFDHCAIYLLIAGTYTPFALVTLRGGWGWSLFGVTWGLALFGIIQELTLGRRTRLLSMILYVVMGWLVVIAIKPLVAALPTAGLAWLAAGGVVYSIGIYFFLNDEKVRHYHGIWHLFVLGGSLCQYISILFYVA